MNESELREHIPAPLGGVEPHAPLLTIPPDGQLLYKIMSVENLLRSIVGNYLHFNRVDSYSDFPGADPHDGRQLPEDQQRGIGEVLSYLNTWGLLPSARWRPCCA